MRLRLSAFLLAITVALAPALAGAAACAQENGCCCAHDGDEAEETHLERSCGCEFTPAGQTDRQDAVATPSKAQQDAPQTAIWVQSVDLGWPAHALGHHFRFRAPPGSSGPVYLRACRLLL